MEIKINNTASLSTRAVRPGVRIPLSSVELSPSQDSLYNSLDIKRPLKSNPSDLAFKGSFLTSLYKQTNESGYLRKDLDLAKEVLGSGVDKLYEHVKNSELTNKMFKSEVLSNGEEKVFFNSKRIPLLLYEEVIYPFKDLPGVILNTAVSSLRKIKFLNSWAEKTYNGKLLKGIRQHSKADAQVNSLRGLFEKTAEARLAAEEKFKNIENADEKNKKIEDYVKETLLKQSSKMSDPKSGNYDTKHERSLCRVVSGMIPAVFLANDAYNLSNMCDGNSKSATKEQKIRFKQEVSRVGVNAYLTLITMGALQKYMNKSKLAIILNTGVTVLLTEMFSRLANGKHITMLSPEKAKEINSKEKQKKLSQSKALNKNVSKDFEKTTFSGNQKPETSLTKKPTEAKTKEKEPLMNFNTVLKASAVIIAAGFGIKGLKKIKFVNNQFDFVKDLWKKNYTKLTVNKDYTVTKDKLDKILKSMEDSDCKELASQYKKISEKYFDVKDNLYHLGEKDKKYIAPLAKFFVTPVKFTYDAISLPYRMTNKLVKVIMGVKSPKKPPKADNIIFRQTIDKIWEQGLKGGKDYDKNRLRDYIQDNIAKSFNAESMSSLPNNELANLAKNSATAATIWFLMADNYNMVMLKSDGEDVKGAQLKRKQRVVQEASRLFYQTLLIDLFNTTFQTQYNNSLWGMSWITAIDTTLGEILTRKSVGMPVKAHSQKELINIEEKKENAKGFTKSYYDFMTKLTGKQSLKEQRVAKQQKVKEKITTTK